MFVLYEVVLSLVFLATLPFFLIIGFLRGKYVTNFPARAGFYRSRPDAHDVWLHAVSVGEVLASKPVIDELLRLRPETSLVVTTTTITGQAQARRIYADATVTYFPLDFSFSVNRFLDHHRPRVFATMETEIWPNAVRLSRRRGMRLLLANGRISDRSFPRYRALRALLGPVLAMYDRILVREDNDRQRMLAMGAPAGRVETAGNVKFDYRPDTTPLPVADSLQHLIAGRRVLVLGSTMEGEDEELLPELERFIREHNALVIIAPRKPERFEVVAALLATTSLHFVRRSEMNGARADVLLLDTFGELARIYAYATAAFIGGTIAPFGGHNPIEAAAAGVPVCFGPSMSNFREIAAAFLEGGGAVEVRTAGEVIAFAERMFENEAEQRDRGAKARATVERSRGAAERTARAIVELLA